MKEQTIKQLQSLTRIAENLRVLRNNVDKSTEAVIEAYNRALIAVVGVIERMANDEAGK